MKVILEKNDLTTIVLADITPEMEVCLLHDLLNVEKWVSEGLSGIIFNKIEACKNRMLLEGRAILTRDPTITSLPTNETSLLDQIKRHTNYKNRAQRDAIEFANLPPTLVRPA